MSRQTSAGPWFDARQQGRRLLAHELSEDLHCGLCGHGMYPHEFSQAVRDTTNMDICAGCLEAMTEDDSAPTDDPRTEVGLVGGCH